MMSFLNSSERYGYYLRYLNSLRTNSPTFYNVKLGGGDGKCLCSTFQGILLIPALSGTDTRLVDSQIGIGFSSYFITPSTGEPAQ